MFSLEFGWLNKRNCGSSIVCYSFYPLEAEVEVAVILSVGDDGSIHPKGSDNQCLCLVGNNNVGPCPCWQNNVLKWEVKGQRLYAYEHELCLAAGSSSVYWPFAILGTCSESNDVIIKSKSQKQKALPKIPSLNRTMPLCTVFSHYNPT